MSKFARKAIFEPMRKADNGADGNSSVDITAVNNTLARDNEESPKKFTQEEVDSIIQKRLSREMNKFKETLDKEKKEAEELAKLNEQQKQKYLLDKQAAELEETKKALTLDRIKFETTKILSQRNIPIDFVDFLVAEDNEKTLERINNFDEFFKKAVSVEVDKRYKSNGRKVETSGESISFNPYKLETFNLTKQLDIESKNPELAKKLQREAN